MHKKVALFLLTFAVSTLLQVGYTGKKHSNHQIKWIFWFQENVLKLFFYLFKVNIDHMRFHTPMVCSLAHS